MFNAGQCVVSRRAVCPYHSHASFKDYFQENDNIKSYILSKSLSGLKGYNLLQYFQSIKRTLKKIDELRYQISLYDSPLLFIVCL